VAAAGVMAPRVAVTFIPGRTRSWPLTTISSPAFNPDCTTRSPSTMRPMVTARYATVLSGWSTSTNFRSWSVPIA
jgi:hypothetical protein